MPGASGRKSRFAELNLANKYNDLTPKFFAFITEMLDSGDKNDRKWAVEQLGKAYVKMIPQTIEGDIDHPIPILNLTSNAVQGNNSNSQDTSVKQEN